MSNPQSDRDDGVDGEGTFPKVQSPQIPGTEALLRKGARDGEIIMVQEVVKYSWSASRRKWRRVGCSCSNACVSTTQEDVIDRRVRKTTGSGVVFLDYTEDQQIIKSLALKKEDDPDYVVSMSKQTRGRKLKPTPKGRPSNFNKEVEYFGIDDSTPKKRQRKLKPSPQGRPSNFNKKVEYFGTDDSTPKKRQRLSPMPYSEMMELSMRNVEDSGQSTPHKKKPTEDSPTFSELMELAKRNVEDSGKSAVGKKRRASSGNREGSTKRVRSIDNEINTVIANQLQRQSLNIPTNPTAGTANTKRVRIIDPLEKNFARNSHCFLLRNYRKVYNHILSSNGAMTKKWKSFDKNAYSKKARLKKEARVERLTQSLWIPLNQRFIMSVDDKELSPLERNFIINSHCFLLREQKKVRIQSKQILFGITAKKPKLWKSLDKNAYSEQEKRSKQARVEALLEALWGRKSTASNQHVTAKIATELVSTEKVFIAKWNCFLLRNYRKVRTHCEKVVKGIVTKTWKSLNINTYSEEEKLRKQARVDAIADSVNLNVQTLEGYGNNINQIIEIRVDPE